MRSEDSGIILGIKAEIDDCKWHIEYAYGEIKTCRECMLTELQRGSAPENTDISYLESLTGRMSTAKTSLDSYKERLKMLEFLLKKAELSEAQEARR